MDQMLKLIERVGRHICILKIHSAQFGTNLSHDGKMQLLYDLKKKYNFLLFEDAKFFDGPETVRGVYQSSFAKYVDIVTVVPDFQDAIFNAIEAGAKNLELGEDEPRGCLAVCELSFANVIRPEGEKLLEIAERNQSICVGIIAQKLQVSDRSNMIKATPGVHLQKSDDGNSQQWRTPEKILEDGTDVMIVGRGITLAPEDEWESLAIQYKEQCFRA